MAPRDHCAIPTASHLQLGCVQQTVLATTGARTYVVHSIYMRCGNLLAQLRPIWEEPSRQPQCKSAKPMKACDQTFNTGRPLLMEGPDSTPLSAELTMVTSHQCITPTYDTNDSQQHSHEQPTPTPHTHHDTNNSHQQPYQPPHKQPTSTTTPVPTPMPTHNSTI